MLGIKGKKGAESGLSGIGPGFGAVALPVALVLPERLVELEFPQFRG